MPNEKLNYMAQLEAWIEREVFTPVQEAISGGDAKELQLAFERGTKAIKRKVLESYRNGKGAK